MILTTTTTLTPCSWSDRPTLKVQELTVVGAISPRARNWAVPMHRAFGIDVLAYASVEAAYA